MAHILLIEDSVEAQFLTKRAIEKNNTVEIASSLHEAKSRIADTDFDLILLDVTLPDGNGMDFCRVLEEEGVTKRTPVIMLTAKSDTNDKVHGLTMGADDYLAKPFDTRELVARISAVLKRRGISFDGDIEIGPIVISLVEQKAYKKISGNQVQLDLTPIEFKILSALARKASDTISREDLFEYVWGKDIHLSVRNIDTHVCKLRHKIAETGITLRSSRGRGYLLAPPPKLRKEPEKRSHEFVLPQGAL